MQTKDSFHINLLSVSAFIPGVFLSLLLVACNEIDGPAIEARPQSISFSSFPTLNLDDTATKTATVAATASSGLAVSYSSMNKAVCTVDSSSGLVEALRPGDCIIEANQSGNTTYAPAPEATQSIPIIYDPNQTITFDPAPPLYIYSTEFVSATASSGLSVSYVSDTQSICSVDSSSGLVTAAGTPGDCIITAYQAGDANYVEAWSAPLTTTVIDIEPGDITKPSAPTVVAATLGEVSSEVIVTFGATYSGGRKITGYTVSSIPSGITETGPTTPITVICPSTCTGEAFSVIATTNEGDSEPSAQAEVITAYNVIETFYEPLTQPRDSIFIGTFTFNSTTRTVSNLQGELSESMTGDLIAYPDDTMNWLPLDHQLSSVYNPALGGLLVTTFLNSDRNTFTTYFGDDGWSPGTGNALHYNFDLTLPDFGLSANPGNAYAMIFVNTEDPTAPLTQEQIDKLAYADCAPLGMMGQLCMTGTTVAGYGVAGSMDGYPVSQVITRQPITDSAPPGMTVPGAPTGVTATLGGALNEVIVTIGATDTGGSPITEYTVTSDPGGFTGTGTTTPVTVTCNPTCTGEAFSVIATNTIGDSTPSAPADVITTYEVIETFDEPLTQPRDSIFIGTFTFNSTTREVSNLQGMLSESMTGSLVAYPDDDMNWLPLNHQLSSVYDPVLGGLLVTTFLNSNINTFTTYFGDDGWSPGTGDALHYNFDPFLPDMGLSANPGNAYAMIFVNTEDPTAPVTQEQIDKLAYANCAPGGMMGALCMTGTTVAGYGVAGSIDGYPVSQVITRQP